MRVILSQAIQEWIEGATTRVWSPERTVKPQERGTPLKGDDIVWSLWQHREAVIKKAAITLRVWAGNLTCSNRSLQGVMIDD